MMGEQAAHLSRRSLTKSLAFSEMFFHACPDILGVSAKMERLRAEHHSPLIPGKAALHPGCSMAFLSKQDPYGIAQLSRAMSPEGTI